jgi:hypothetical protein
MPAGKLAASDCRPLFARGQRAGPGVSLRWFFFVVLACRQSLVEPKRQAERPERTEEAQWNLVLSITDRGHAGHRLQLLAPVHRLSANFTRLVGPLASLFLSSAICEQQKQLLQDQKNQTRDQHNGCYPYYGEYQCLRRRVVTYTLALHCKVRSKQIGGPREERQALNADYRMQFDECHASNCL